MPFLYYLVSIPILLTALVFVHELGHFLAARRCGVRVEVFSVGFGPELLGWTDRLGTRWRLSLVPLGGYVRMFGEMDVTGAAPGQPLTEEERQVSFPAKTVLQRAFIVAAGPAANYLFAIVAAAAIYMTVGLPSTPPVVGQVEANSPAAMAGIQPGDRFVSVGGARIDRFEDLQRVVASNPGARLATRIIRDGKPLALTVVPERVTDPDAIGPQQEIGRIGVSHAAGTAERLGPFAAVGAAVDNAITTSGMIFRMVGQMVEGRRSAQELGGIITIGHLSGEVAQLGPIAFINLLVMLSINLGLLNLLPIPMLDGGHLLFYAAEAIRGRPLGERAQEIGFRIGFAFVVGLMIFANWNDLVRFRIIELVRQIVS